MDHSSFSIIEQRQKQDYLIFSKTRPQNHKIVRAIINSYGNKNPITKKIIKLINEEVPYQKLIEECEKYFYERESYLNKMCESL